MKNLTLTLLIFLLLTGCSSKTDKNKSEELTKKDIIMKTSKTGTIMQIVRLKTELSKEELLKVAKERDPQYKALTGLVQKYYVQLEQPGEYMGVMIWDSPESLKEFKESELAATIPKAYKVTEPPTIEIVDILFQLRE